MTSHWTTSDKWLGRSFGSKCFKEIRNMDRLLTWPNALCNNCSQLYCWFPHHKWVDCSLFLLMHTLFQNCKVLQGKTGFCKTVPIWRCSPSTVTMLASQGGGFFDKDPLTHRSSLVGTGTTEFQASFHY